MNSSATSRATPARSTSRSTKAAERLRAVASRSSSSRLIRPVARVTTAVASRRSSGVDCSLPSTASTLAWITATGLRSSWETSSTRARSARKAVSRRSSMLLIVSASVRSSSGGPVVAIRRDRSVAVISRVVVVIISTGRSARPATHQPMATLSPNMITSATIE